MYQYQTAIWDGPVGVTQCPINPGQSFTYTFKAYPAGTHWYHSHDVSTLYACPTMNHPFCDGVNTWGLTQVGVFSAPMLTVTQKGQYPDGLRGKMIIHDPEWEKGLNVV